MANQHTDLTGQNRNAMQIDKQMDSDKQKNTRRGEGRVRDTKKGRKEGGRLVNRWGGEEIDR